MCPLNHGARLRLRPTQLSKMYSTERQPDFMTQDGWASVWAGQDASIGWFGLWETINQTGTTGLGSGGVMIQTACGRPLPSHQVLRVHPLRQTLRFTVHHCSPDAQRHWSLQTHHCGHCVKITSSSNNRAHRPLIQKWRRQKHLFSLEVKNYMVSFNSKENLILHAEYRQDF